MTLKKNNTDCINDVIKIILYFDGFQYPITFNEISLFSQFSDKEIQHALDSLINQKILFFNENFYSVTNNLCAIKRRKKGNKSAKKVLIKAAKVSKFISQFPFVEGVFISGSLSKGYFGEDDDIDFFIITRHNRLWLARTLLIAYKKMFLLNSKKYFCVNYFMSTNALEIAEKNRFTATEFVTLIPMSGNGIYCDLKKNNKWVLDYFPHFSNQTKISKPINKNTIKRVLEFMFKGVLGNWLDAYFMKITKKHQQKKFADLDKSNFDIAFKGEKNVSKHHPGNHQKRVIDLLNNNIIAFNKKHQYSIPLDH